MEPAAVLSSFKPNALSLDAGWRVATSLTAMTAIGGIFIGGGRFEPMVRASESVGLSSVWVEHLGAWVTERADGVGTLGLLLGTLAVLVVITVDTLNMQSRYIATLVFSVAVVAMALPHGWIWALMLMTAAAAGRWARTRDVDEVSELLAGAGIAVLFVPLLLVWTLSDDKTGKG